MNFWDVIEQNEPERLYLIIKKIDINRDIKDQFGYSPILLALAKSSLNTIPILVNAGFNLNEKDPKGQTALHYCAFYNFLDCAALLLEKGASLNIEDNYGNQPLWTAVFNDKGFGNRLEMIMLFVKFKANKNHKNKVGKTPLEIAQTHAYNSIVEVMNNKIP